MFARFLEPLKNAGVLRLRPVVWSVLHDGSNTAVPPQRVPSYTVIRALEQFAEQAPVESVGAGSGKSSGNDSPLGRGGEE